MVGVVFVKHSQHNSKLMECWDVVFWAVGLSDRRTIRPSDYRIVGILGYNAHARFLSTRIQEQMKNHV